MLASSSRVFDVGHQQAASTGGSARLTAADIEIQTLRQRLERAERELNTDLLTGIANRRALFAFADSLCGPAVVALVDLDGFKPINDHYGHHAGDEVLQAVARRLNRSLGVFGLVARLGGDEFAAILTHGLPATGAADIAKAAKKALNLAARSVAAPLEVDGRLFIVNASVGVAITGTGVPFATTLHEADMAMYRAKRHRSGVAFYDPATDITEANGGERPSPRFRDLSVSPEPLREVA